MARMSLTERRQRENAKEFLDEVIKNEIEMEVEKCGKMAQDYIEDVIRQEIMKATSGKPAGKHVKDPGDKHDKQEGVSVNPGAIRKSGDRRIRPSVAEIWDMWKYQSANTRSIPEANTRSIPEANTRSIPEAFQLGNTSYWELDACLSWFVQDVTSGMFSLPEPCYHSDHGNCRNHGVANALWSFLEELRNFIAQSPISQHYHDFLSPLRQPTNAYPRLVWALEKFNNMSLMLKSRQMQIARQGGLMPQMVQGKQGGLMPQVVQGKQEPVGSVMADKHAKKKVSKKSKGSESLDMPGLTALLHGQGQQNVDATDQGLKSATPTPGLRSLLKEQAQQTWPEHMVGPQMYKDPLNGFYAALPAGKPSADSRSSELVMSPEIETDLWKKGILGTTDSQTLLLTVYFYVSKVFGVRTKNDHRDLKLTQFTMGQDNQGRLIFFSKI